METIWPLLRRSLPILGAVSLLAALVAAGTVSRLENGWVVHFSYVVSLTEREAVPAYHFDGYYALQANELYAKTLAEWITAPEMVAQAYQISGLTTPGGWLAGITAEATAPQLVRVTVRAPERDTAERLAEGVQAVVRSGVPAEFKVSATKPWITRAGLNKRVVGGATGGLVFFIGLNLMVLYASLRYEHRR